MNTAYEVVCEKAAKLWPVRKAWGGGVEGGEWKLTGTRFVIETKVALEDEDKAALEAREMLSVVCDELMRIPIEGVFVVDQGKHLSLVGLGALLIERLNLKAREDWAVVVRRLKIV